MQACARQIQQSKCSLISDSLRGVVVVVVGVVVVDDAAGNTRHTSIHAELRLAHFETPYRQFTNGLHSIPPIILILPAHIVASGVHTFT